MLISTHMLLTLRLRLLFTLIFIQPLLAGCSIFPSGVAQPVPVPIRTNLLESESDLSNESWLTNSVSVEQLDTRSEVLYAPPAPSYTYLLPSRLIVTGGDGAPSVEQVITGAQHKHLYRMTAVLQAYDEEAAVVIRFARTSDKSPYTDAEFLVTLNEGVKRVTFEFYLAEEVDSFIFALEPKLEPGQFIDIGELRLWE